MKKFLCFSCLFLAFPIFATPSPTPQPQTITYGELAKRPKLIVNQLVYAVLQGNIERVKLLSPLYQKLSPEHKDEILSLWINAILAKSERQYSEAIAAYRHIIAKQSNLHSARLQLAMTLFEDRQFEAAEDQFHKLRAENLDAGYLNVIDQYLSALSQQNRWSISGGITYLNDPNINNAPKEGTRVGNWRANKPESGDGLGFNLEIDKKWPWKNRFYHEFKLNSQGKYYWNNKKYNELTYRTSLGLGYQNAKFQITLLPFIQQTFYAGGKPEEETLKRYFNSSGISLDINYWLSKQVQIFGNYEYDEHRYRQRKHLNGNSHFIGLGTVYYHSSQQYWLVNLYYQRYSTQTKDDSYNRKGILFGWGQEWNFGISSQISLNYAHKNYKAPMPIFGVLQKNKELTLSFSLWHRAWHFMGITPKLTYRIQHIKSNHAFYSYDKRQVFLEFSKKF